MKFKPHRNCLVLVRFVFLDQFLIFSLNSFYAQDKIMLIYQSFSVLNKKTKIEQYGLFLVVAMELRVTKNSYRWVLVQCSTIGQVTNLLLIATREK